MRHTSRAPGSQYIQLDALWETYKQRRRADMLWQSRAAHLLARLYSFGVGMQQTTPADNVGLQASVAHVHHHSAHLTRLAALGPCLDQYVAQPQSRLQTRQEQCRCQAFAVQRDNAIEALVKRAQLGVSCRDVSCRLLQLLLQRVCTV